MKGIIPRSTRSPHRPPGLLAATLACLACAALASAQDADEPAPKDAKPVDPVLLESFEDLAHLEVRGGRLDAVSGGEMVTEGKQAAKLPAGATVRITVDAAKLAGRSWLRLDTGTLQPLAQDVRVIIEAEGIGFDRAAVVQAGRDVLALPLTWPLRDKVNWPAGRVTIGITNSSQFPLVLDNLRAEPPAAAPQEAVLVDFGPDDQVVWPGFSAGRTRNSHLVWSGEKDIRARAGSGGDGFLPPDPLGGDFVGPIIQDMVADLATVEPKNRDLAVCLWVTHYAGDFCQPGKWVLKLGEKTLASGDVSDSQMLGPKGLLEGLDADWTAQWFDQEQAAHYVETVSFSLRAGSNRLGVGNCQIAALALAPSSRKKELDAYVEQIKADLTRFRRQFVVAGRSDTRCRLSPSEQEQRDGGMIFRPPDNEAYSATWTPADGDRVGILRTTVANGQLVAVPLAIVPLKPSGMLRVTLSPLRSESGRMLPVDAQRTSASLLDRVPVVRDARVVFQPWALTDRLGKTDAGEVAWTVVTIAPDLAAEPGLYKGNLRFSFTGGTINLPLEVTVLRMEVGMPAGPLLGAYRQDADARGFFGPLAATWSDPVGRAATAAVRHDALAGPLNCLPLEGVHLDRDLGRSEGYCKKDLQSLPSPLPAGLTGVFSVDSALWPLRRRQIEPGTRKHAEAIGSVVARTMGLAHEAGLGAAMFSVGYAGTKDDLQRLGVLADEVAQYSGRSLVRTEPLTDEGLEDVLGPFRNVLVNIDGRTPAFLDRLAKLRPTKRALVYMVHPDRFAAGFYAAGVGADGGFVYAVAPPGPPYAGFHFNGDGLLILRPGKTLAPTLGMLHLTCGADDWRLVQRCRRLVTLAPQAKVDPVALAGILEQFRTEVRKTQEVGYRVERVRGSGMPPSQIETWRAALTRAAADLSQKIREKVKD